MTYLPPLEDDDLAAAGADAFLAHDPGPEQRGYQPTGRVTPPTSPVRRYLPRPSSLTTAQLAPYSVEYLRRVRELLAGVEALS